MKDVEGFRVLSMLFRPFQALNEGRFHMPQLISKLFSPVFTEVEVVAGTGSFRQLAKCRPLNGDRILEIGGRHLDCFLRSPTKEQQ